MAEMIRFSCPSCQTKAAIGTHENLMINGDSGYITRPLTRALMDQLRTCAKYGVPWETVLKRDFKCGACNQEHPFRTYREPYEKIYLLQTRYEFTMKALHKPEGKPMPKRDAVTDKHVDDLFDIDGEPIEQWYVLNEGRTAVVEEKGVIIEPVPLKRNQYRDEDGTVRQRVANDVLPTERYAGSESIAAMKEHDAAETLRKYRSGEAIDWVALAEKY